MFNPVGQPLNDRYLLQYLLNEPVLAQFPMQYQTLYACKNPKLFCHKTTVGEFLQNNKVRILQNGLTVQEFAFQPELRPDPEWFTLHENDTPFSALAVHCQSCNDYILKDGNHRFVNACSNKRDDLSVTILGVSGQFTVKEEDIDVFNYCSCARRTK